MITRTGYRVMRNGERVGRAMYSTRPEAEEAMAWRFKTDVEGGTQEVKYEVVLFLEQTLLTATLSGGAMTVGFGG